MNVKKEVIEKMARFMEGERWEIQRKIIHNKIDIKKLAKDQTILKRQLVEFDKLFNHFRVKKEEQKK